MTRTKDYAITMQDSTGRTCVLSINGACIDERVADGYSEDHAREDVESNAFEKAIARGDIGADATMV